MQSLQYQRALEHHDCGPQGAYTCFTNTTVLRILALLVRPYCVYDSTTYTTVGLKVRILALLVRQYFAALVRKYLLLLAVLVLNCLRY